MSKHAITLKVNDELVRYQTVKDYMDSLIQNDTELLSVVKNSAGSYSSSRIFYNSNSAPGIGIKKLPTDYVVGSPA
ncbi:hypothetical protein [Anaerocolumna jejuensis]|uniref:hypothetical protein n=1 Tax=Anaerocolumna jejuensis TaxID=259063 RepID=UPI003F7BA975